MKLTNTTKAVIAIAAVVVLAAAFLLFRSIGQPGTAYIDPSDQTVLVRGKEIYAANCASCHGQNLEGQPDWRARLPNGRLPAPPHDDSGHTWHHPDAVLIDIVRNGLVPGITAPPGYESDMPAYKDVLTEDDILAVLAYIKSSWSQTAREAQKEVTMRRQE